MEYSSLYYKMGEADDELLTRAVGCWIRDEPNYNANNRNGPYEFKRYLKKIPGDASPLQLRKWYGVCYIKRKLNSKQIVYSSDLLCYCLFNVAHETSELNPYK